MTYLVLARKWRPRSFETLVGQDHVVRALTHALSTQRLHHAWLFTGTRGVGKTTLSRILAKSLNCETGITATPCGKCRACTEIDEGRFVDYLELDAASNRGVDEMTQLLEQAVYAPGAGRFKVYMIDEVHMLTGHAFNAMLKTLEEPPPHVKFILATTDPQKIPVTVLSRCLQFNLKQMPAESIVGHLQQVLGEEQIGFEVPALRLIGQAAGGSMRDALSLTDQAIAYSAGNLSEEAVRGMLGTIDQRHLARLLDALAAGDGAAVLAVADELATRGLSYSGALGDLATLLSRIAIEQRVPGATSPDDPLAGDIARLAAGLHPDALQLFYSVAVHSRSELALAPDEYAGFVMACLRMLALADENGGLTPRAVPAPAVQAAASSAGAQAAASAAAPSIAASTPPAVAPAVSAAPTQASTAAAVQPVFAPASAAVPDQTGQTGSAQAPASSAAPLPSPASAPAPAAAAAMASSPHAGEPAAAADVQPAATAEPPTTVQAAAPTPLPASAAPVLHDAASAASRPAPSRQPTPPAPSADDLPGGEPPPYFDDPPFDPDMSYGEPVGLDDDFESPSRSSEPAALRPRAAPQQSAEGRPARRAAAAPSPASSAAGAPVQADGQPGDLPPIVLEGPWHKLAVRLPIGGLAGELARQSEWLGVKGRTITLRVAARVLLDGPARARLRNALGEHFGGAVQLEIIAGETGDETAHAVDQAARRARQAAAEEAVQADPFVQALLNDFGGAIVPGSVQPLQSPSAAA